MELGDLPREYDHISGVTRTMRGVHTLTLLTEVGPVGAAAAVYGREVNYTRAVCLTDGPARASAVGHVVTVDKIGRAIVGVFVF